MKQLPENVLRLQFKSADEILESMDALNEILAFHIEEYRNANYFAKLFKYKKIGKNYRLIVSGFDNSWYVRQVYDKSIQTKETKELCGLLISYLFDLAQLKDTIIKTLCLDPETKKFKKSAGLENWKKISGNLMLPGIKRIGET